MLFSDLPPWAAPIGAAAVMGASLILPKAFGVRPLYEPFSVAFGALAAGAILFGGLLGAVKRWGRRRLLAHNRTVDAIRRLTWIEFERLVGEAYRQQGYAITESGGGDPDGGYDLDMSGPDGRVLVQCKHWKSFRVGVREVRELAGVVTGLDADRGAIVSTGSFTTAAADFARTVRIDLIDGAALDRMLPGLSMPRLKSGDASPTPTESTSGSVVCPNCGSPMVRRIARRGGRSGSAFWGCSTYPACRGTLAAA